MKGLLHSKRFQKNLAKWLLMYVGVMGLLTTVITYSKYITNLQDVSDSARVARFKIDITDKECETDDEKYCNYTSYRPTDEIEYYFKVDTTGLEVNTKVYLTFYINENFTISDDVLEIDALDEGKTRSIPIDKTQSPTIYDGKNYYVKTITDGLYTFHASENEVKIYKITLRYNKDNYTEFFTGDNQPGEPIVKLDYSAIQQPN